MGRKGGTSSNTSSIRASAVSSAISLASLSRCEPRPASSRAPPSKFRAASTTKMVMSTSFTASLAETMTERATRAWGVRVSD